MKKFVAYKLSSFPNVSETFVLSNVVCALKQHFEIQLFVDKYKGVNNTSQEVVFRKYALDKTIEAPKKLSENSVLRWCQYAYMALHPRVFKFRFSYYKNKSKRNSKPLLQLYQYRNFNKNSICHVHFNNALHPLPNLAEIGYINPKVIVTFHGYDAFLETEKSFSAKYSSFYKEYVKAVTVNSNYLKKQLLSLGIANSLIHVVPIGIDMAEFKGNEKTITPHSPIKLITIGRLVQLKGHQYALECLKKLKDAGYSVHYDIVGEGQQLEILQKQVLELNLTDNVTFFGRANQEEVKIALQNSHIFLMPSTYDELNGRREAFGLVSVEAQAMGLPVIGFNSGGFPDTVREGITGFAVADRDTAKMTEKIKFLIDNPPTYNSMSKVAILHAATFDHQHTTQEYISLYDQIS